jgi:hypothetical protein
MPVAIASSASAQTSQYQSPLETEAETTEIACKEEIVEVARAGAAVLGSVAALVAATPTILGVLPGVAAFVGSSLYMGKAAAELANCRDQATAKAK